MGFPTVRLRRLRRSEALRSLVRETPLAPSDFIYPLFVVPGSGRREEIPSLPGVFHWSVDRVVEEAARAHQDGIGAVILFGLPEAKDPLGSEAYADDGAVCQAIRAVKAAVDDLVVMTDVCLCAYTDHGHCGVLGPDGVDNDRTLGLLSRMALAHAAAGADVVAPSDMMDGRVGAVRNALDEAGRTDVAVMAYAAKFASAFYGPFREAAASTPAFGDRRGYQMDPANVREALRELGLDAEEGADILMVKPALAYLDVIRAARERFLHPLAAYNVSGEYAMVKAAAARGWIDEPRAVLEALTAMRRAGADLILTYHAREAAGWLRADAG